MASTRNRNTPNDYCLQQRDSSLAHNYISYKNGQQGQAFSPAIPSIGYMPTYMPRDTFSHNSVDIESSLRGINSTNLVNPEEPLKPEFKTVPMRPFFETLPIIMPNPLVIENNQRPFPIGG
jgi:hypothetical protein